MNEMPAMKIRLKAALAAIVEMAILVFVVYWGIRYGTEAIQRWSGSAIPPWALRVVYMIGLIFALALGLSRQNHYLEKWARR
jgi:hypothetical protein